MTKTKQHELFYKGFKDKSIIISEKWKDFIDDEWTGYYGFEAISIPTVIWRQEKLLRRMHRVFPFKNVGLIRLPINYNYNWHKDINRGCGINMLLEHGTSYTLFEANEALSNKSNNKNYNFDEFGTKFIELNYQPNTFYVFNTQKLHCVFNFEKPRYLFTCEFAQDHKELSYEMVCEWMKQNNLTT